MTTSDWIALGALIIAAVSLAVSMNDRKRIREHNDRIYYLEQEKLNINKLERAGEEAQKSILNQQVLKSAYLELLSFYKHYQKVRKEHISGRTTNKNPFMSLHNSSLAELKSDQSFTLGSKLRPIIVDVMAGIERTKEPGWRERIRNQEFDEPFQTSIRDLLSGLSVLLESSENEL